LNYRLDTVIGLAFLLSGVTGVAFLLMGDGGGYQGRWNAGFATPPRPHQAKEQVCKVMA
jgi:hypothetical protein